MCDPSVAGQGQLHSTAKRVALKGRHNGFAASLNNLDQARQCRTLDAPQFRYIKPGRKMRPFGGQNDGRNGWICLGSLHGFAQRGHQSSIQGIDGRSLQAKHNHRT